ncbi:hypothetical protein DBP20_14085 [Streptomyces sp. CS131]|nr:hypothetical protein DBP20_14085 [Streptomyces sp. CS131]
MLFSLFLVSVALTTDSTRFGPLAYAQPIPVMQPSFHSPSATQNVAPFAVNSATDPDSSHVTLPTDSPWAVRMR